MESRAFPKWSIWRNEGSSGAAEPTSNGKRAHLRPSPIGTSVCEEKRAEPERSQRRSVAERSIRWSRWFGRCVLERFCSAKPPMTAAFTDRLPCSIQSGDFATFSCRRYRPGSTLSGTRFARAGAPGPRIASRDIGFNEALPAVLQRMAGRIDQSECIQDFRRIDSGDAHCCWRFGWDVGDGSGAIPEGEDRDGGSSGAPEPSSQRKRARLRNLIRS